MTQTTEIYRIFDISSPESNGLILLKKAIFEEFIKTLGNEAIVRFAEYKRLIPPTSIEGRREWISHSINRLGLNSKELCAALQLEPTKFSKFLNGKIEYSKDDHQKIHNEIKTRLIAAKLLIP